jgi:hypothetical protein
VNLGDSYGEPKKSAFRHLAKKHYHRQYLHAMVSSQVEIFQSLRRSRNAGHQASVHSISVSRSRQIGRQTGRIGGIVLLVGFISVVFEVLGVADFRCF